MASALVATVAVTMGLGATCRTMPATRTGRPPSAPAAPAAAPVAIAPPVIRVGILPDVPRSSIGADSGVVVRGVAGQGAPTDRQVARATFVGVGEAVRLVETGEQFGSVTLFPVRPEETLLVEATPYRGILEVRAGAPGTVTVINVLNLEDYLRGVVPNELSPTAFGELEALKAQAVAARTYALRNMGQYAAKGYDICATPACQVYRGKSTENPLSDQAVAETRGTTAAYRGQLINALYTSTCGGHTEDGGNIFDGEELPYLRGVVCAPEQVAWSTIRTTTAPVSLGEEPGLAREAALLVSLDVLPSSLYSASALQANTTEEETREWVSRLVTALHRKGCEVADEGSLAHRGAFVRHLVGALCWDERAQRLLAPGDPDYLLKVEDRADLGSEAERLAAALLISEGVLSPLPDNTLRPAAVLTRAQAVGMLARVAERAGAPGVVTAEFREARAGALTVDVGGTAESHPIDPAVRLFRDLDGTRVASSELSVVAGDKVRYVVQGGRVTFLEGDQSRLGTAADKTSRVYRWEVRESPSELKTALARYGDVGTPTDLLPRRLGVSGRVIEMAVTGTGGELVLKGLQVRWGLGLRENLFVVDRERDAAGAVERFVFTGKGWGHGVGLCQVGAFGMAQSGSSFDTILRHYYTGIQLERSY
ncbi:MAG TPA: SpoIID/LytB domain-containing protein [Vicinamibacteria bacterium]